MKKFVDISFDKRDGSTVKDVTYLGYDTYYYTIEFKDVSPLEATIMWMPPSKSGSFIQSRSLSRIFGKPVKLQLPEDFKELLSVDITYESSNERVKNIAYLSTDGKILTKEFREGILDRMFEGWGEIKGISNEAESEIALPEPDKGL